MINSLLIFGATSSGLGALGVNGKAFIIQLITFILALLVLRKWAFKPILKVLNERRRIIDNGVKLGQQMQKEQAELEAQISQKLHEASQKADSIIALAEQQARQVVQTAEENAREKFKIIISEADERIKQDTLKAQKKLKQELVVLVSDATEAIIEEKIDAQKDATLISKALKEQGV